MGKLEDLMRTAGGSIAQAASVRPAPVAMPNLNGLGPARDPYRDGLARSAEFWLVPLDRIDPDGDQPRDGDIEREVDEQTGELVEDPDFARLVASLDTDGLLQPITLLHAEVPGRFRIFMGERRWRAARRLGWPSISARVVASVADLEPGDLLARQGVENLIRKDLKPVQRARLFRNLLDKHGWTQEKLGGRFGYSKGLISQALALLELPVDVQLRVDAGQIDAMRGYHLGKLKDPEEQKALADRVISENLSQQETAEAVRDVTERRAREASPKGPGKGGKSKVKPKPVTSRVFKTAPGIRITAERARGIDLASLVAALEEATSRVKAEIEAGQGGQDQRAA